MVMNMKSQQMIAKSHIAANFCAFIRSRYTTLEREHGRLIFVVDVAFSVLSVGHIVLIPERYGSTQNAAK